MEFELLVGPEGLSLRARGRILVGDSSGDVTLGMAPAPESGVPGGEGRTRAHQEAPCGTDHSLRALYTMGLVNAAQLVAPTRAKKAGVAGTLHAGSAEPEILVATRLETMTPNDETR